MIYYQLLFLCFFAHELFAMHNPNHSRVPSLKAIAAQEIHKLGLVCNDIDQNVYDHIMLEEHSHMPNHIVEEHKQRMLAKIQRDNFTIPCTKRVQEKIHTYNALAYMNKK